MGIFHAWLLDNRCIKIICGHIQKNVITDNIVCSLLRGTVLHSGSAYTFFRESPDSAAASEKLTFIS